MDGNYSELLIKQRKHFADQHVGILVQFPGTCFEPVRAAMQDSLVSVAKQFGTCASLSCAGQ